MLVDSHCHLDRVDLAPYHGDFSRFVEETRDAGVDHMLCVAIDLEHYAGMRALVANHEGISVSVGVHPNEKDRHEPDVDELVALADDRAVVAIGETGLDYYREDGDLDWQRERFRTHIRAARAVGTPLIIHSRDARQDTLHILGDEGADGVGGVMHCFTENWEMARAALDLGFMISFSGILTFRNADSLRDVARRVPIERLLIETDSPYLAPVPFRGRSNEPRYVAEVARQVGELHGLAPEAVAEQTRGNFFALFPLAATAA